jgi:hypothetical protein
MMCLSKWVSAVVAIVLLAGAAAAAETVTFGKVKSVNADKKEFVLADAADKDWTFKIGDKVVINRGGKESQSDLQAGDAVNVLYDKGVLAWTARYILVQEGDTKNCDLVRGSVKGYDASKKQLDVTDEQGKERSFAMGDAKVHLNKQDSKVEDVKIGDTVLAIVETVGDKVTLKSVMIDRK